MRAVGPGRKNSAWIAFTSPVCRSISASTASPASGSKGGHPDTCRASWCVMADVGAFQRSWQVESGSTQMVSRALAFIIGWFRRHTSADVCIPSRPHVERLAGIAHQPEPAGQGMKAGRHEAMQIRNETGRHLRQPEHPGPLQDPRPRCGEIDVIHGRFLQRVGRPAVRESFCMAGSETDCR